MLQEMMIMLHIKLPGLTGNISVKSGDELYVSYFNANNGKHPLEVSFQDLLQIQA